MGGVAMGVRPSLLGELCALALLLGATAGAQAQGCPEGQRPSLGWCCPGDSMWDRRYRQCVPDPRRRCSAGELSQCVTVGEHYVGAGDHAQAAIYHRKACTGGELAGCVALGYMAHRGQGRARNDQAAQAHFERACKGGHAAGCTGLAELTIATGKGSDGAGRGQLDASCQQGEPRACSLSALARLELGESIEASQAATVEQACAGGAPLACTAQGRMLTAGGDRTQRARALELHDRACRGGEAVACLHQGELLAEGPTDADIGKARAPLQRACAGGIGRACASLAELFATGKGGAQDGSRAREHHRQACDLGLETSCLRFAELSVAADGSTRDAAAVRAVYERGCNGGSAPMCVRLAAFLLDGDGGGREVARARVVLRKTCEGGQPEACRMLADSFGWEASRARGVEATRGYGFAVQLLTRACALRDAAACTDMGLLHMVGGNGVRRDFGVARRSFERACGLGHADGCMYAGRQALYGHGRARDDAEATAQLAKACSMGAMAACGDAEQTPAVELYPAPYAPGAEVPPRHREAGFDTSRPQARDVERAPPPGGKRTVAAARPALPRAKAPGSDAGATPATGGGLGTALRVAFADNGDQLVAAAVLGQQLDIGKRFSLELQLPVVAGNHIHQDELGMRAREDGGVRTGNVRLGLNHRSGGGDSIVISRAGLVLPSAIATRGDADPVEAIESDEPLELARPSLKMASAAWGLREHALWAYDASGITAGFEHRGREDLLRWSLEVGVATLMPVRDRANAELTADIYGELGVAVGPVVLAAGLGAAFLSDEETGLATLEPSVQHVTAAGQRVFAKGVFVLEPTDVEAGIEPPGWALQLGARF